MQLFRRVAAALPGMEQTEKKPEDSILLYSIHVSTAEPQAYGHLWIQIWLSITGKVHWVSLTTSKKMQKKLLVISGCLL